MNAINVGCLFIVVFCPLICLSGVNANIQIFFYFLGKLKGNSNLSSSLNGFHPTFALPRCHSCGLKDT